MFLKKAYQLETCLEFQRILQGEKEYRQRKEGIETSAFPKLAAGIFLGVCFIPWSVGLVNFQQAK